MADYFYKTANDLYAPAELAMCTFTFENGISKDFHQFVDPGELATNLKT